MDGKDQFGLEAAKTLQNNFYVDDLLKSMAQKDQAIQLIKNVKAMCLSGDFKLARTLSKKPDTILDIDKKQKDPILSWRVQF